MKIFGKEVGSFDCLLNGIVIASILMTALAALFSICMVVQSASDLRRNDCRKSSLIMADGTLTIKE